MLTADPIVQELLRRGVAECGMPAPAVVPQGDSLRGVERLDIVEQIGLRLCPRAVASAMHPLILVAIDETLRRRIVPAV